MPRASAAKSSTPPSTPDTDARFASIVKAFANDTDVTYGRMFAAMGLKVHGKIFAMHVKGTFVAKLPRERVDELVRAKHAVPFDPGHGRVMKEWASIAGREESWLSLAREARRFVGEVASPSGGRAPGGKTRGPR